MNVHDINEVKIEIYIPEEYVPQLAQALSQAGAGRIGDYDHCLTVVPKVRGYWRPLKGANPYLGKVGEVCSGEESKVEVRCQLTDLKVVVEAIRASHPYEEPVFNVIPLLNHGN